MSVEKCLNAYLAENTNTTLVILTPCYGGLLCCSFANSLLATVQYLSKFNITVHVIFNSKESLIQRGRNNLIAKAMALSETTHMLFIDADIAWEPQDVAKLLISNECLIGGIYPQKKYEWDRLMDPNKNIVQELSNIKKNSGDFFENMSTKDFIKAHLVNYNLNYLDAKIKVVDNLIELRHIATGFMMIKRECIDKMIKSYPETKYTDDTGCLNTEAQHKHSYALFDCKIDEKTRSFLSEDWVFCERWRELNGKVFACVDINLDHTGSETYKGSYVTSIL